MSHREAEGGGQMGEAHWKVFLCTVSKPALLQRVGLHESWHPAGFLYLVHVHGNPLVCCSTRCQAGHRKILLHCVLCAISGSWGYIGIITVLLFSFWLLLYMPMSDKQSWLR